MIHDKPLILRDSLIVVVAVFITCFMGNIAIFSVLIHMSETDGIPMVDVAKQGQALVFVVYPEALYDF